MDTLNYITTSAKQRQDWKYHNLLAQSEGLPETFSIFIQMPALDSTALLFAIRMLVQRHESLRTSFREINGEIFQCIHPFKENEIMLSIIDWSMKQPSSSEFEGLMKQVKSSCCDLLSYSLFRCCYVILPGENRCFLMSIPHIICDQRSLGIIKSELSQLYRSILSPGSQFELPCLPIQLRQYTESRIVLESRNAERDFEYWKRNLEAKSDEYLPACSNEVFALRIKKAESMKLNLVIGDGILLQLRQLAVQTCTSLGAVLYAALLLSYSFFSGKNRILLSAPVSDRSRQGYDQIIGNLMGGIYLHLSPFMDETIGHWLQRVSLAFLHAIRHIIFCHPRLGLDELDLRNRCDVYCNLELTSVDRPFYDSFVQGHFQADTQFYKLNISTLIFEEQLLITWCYHRSFYSRAVIEELIRIHKITLRKLTTLEVTTKLIDFF
jgi:Condensation domain